MAVPKHKNQQNFFKREVKWDKPRYKLMFFKTQIIYLSKALQPMQVSCFFANFIMPLFDGVEIEIDLVWLPWRSSLLAFFKIGSKILKIGCNTNNMLRNKKKTLKEI